MAVTFAEYMQSEQQVNQPYRAAWERWYASLPWHRRLQYHLAQQTDRIPSPRGEPARTYQQALLRSILRGTKIRGSDGRAKRGGGCDGRATNRGSPERATTTRGDLPASCACAGHHGAGVPYPVGYHD